MASPLPFGAGAYKDGSYGVPITLQNWMAELAPERADRPYRLIPTPGLEAFCSGLNGSVRGLMRADGLFDGDILAVAGDKVYTVNDQGASSEIGELVSDGLPVSIAFGVSDTVIASGGQVYTVSSDAVTRFDATQGQGVDIGTCLHIDGRFIYLRKGAGAGTVFYSRVLDPDRIEGFVTAESAADGLIGGAILNSTIVLIGTETTELFYLTGSERAPLARREGGVIKRGAMSSYSIAQADFGLFLVGDDGIVYRFQNYQPQRISTHAIEREIASRSKGAKGRISLTAHTEGGHKLIQLDIPGAASYFYDLATGEWHTRASVGMSLYRANWWVEGFGALYCSDRQTGDIYRVRSDLYTDLGNEVVRKASVFVPVQDRRPPIGSLSLDAGIVGQPLTGQGSDPKAMLRWSDDKGRTWGNGVWRGLGAAGDYDYVTEWRRLGRGKPPGRLFEVSLSDPVGLSLDVARLNAVRP